MNRLHAQLLRDAQARGDVQAEAQGSVRHWIYAANDQSGAGYAFASHWLRDGDENLRVQAFNTALICLSYAGKHDEALALLRNHSELLEAGMFRAPALRFYAVTMRAFVLGPILKLGSGERERARSELERILEELWDDDRPMPLRTAACIRAVLALDEGDRGAAFDAVTTALDIASSNGEVVMAASLRWAEGELRGGAGGDALVRRARGELETMGVKNPFKLARLLTAQPLCLWRSEPSRSIGRVRERGRHKAPVEAPTSRSRSRCRGRRPGV